MKFATYSIYSQLYVFPVVKITHDRILNGDLEIIFGWLKWELSVGF
jgi:hypothetical protein